MEALDQQGRINALNKLFKVYDEAKLEVISRSGLVPQKSYIGESSSFDIILEVASYKFVNKFIAILHGDYNLDDTLEYKDEFINHFMTLHHDYVVSRSKFNWNWDQICFVQSHKIYYYCK